MIIYRILFLGLLNWGCFIGSRVLMPLYAIELGASAAGIGLLSMFLANSALMFGGGNENARDAAAGGNAARGS